MNKGYLHTLSLILMSMVFTVFSTGCKLLTGKKDVNIILGTKVPDTAAGEYLNHTVGGTAGANVSHYMDRQAKKLSKKLPNAKVERIGEGIFITFDDSCTFEYGSAVLSPVLKKNLEEFADVSDDFEDSEIIIEAHADSSGTSEKNLELSTKRAKAVAAAIEKEGVDKYRMTTIGYGEDRPAETKKSKQDHNRRVEIVIVASRYLVVEAGKGAID